MPSTLVERPVVNEKGSAGEVFGAFLILGFTAFGGPVAHLGYFRREFVERRKWLDEKAYADLLALCQFLPGPASSQVGFSLGLMRAGPLGALAAFTAFTLPSAILMVLFAYGAGSLGGPVGAGALNGLKVVAVAIVGQAVWGMARTLAPDRPRATIALLAVISVLLLSGWVGQVTAILLGAAAGLALRLPSEPDVGSAFPVPVSRRIAIAALVIFAAVLVGMPLLSGLTAVPALDLFDTFYRAGALVFGGGHVVLPLLESGTVGAGLLDEPTFLAGYGAAQALPGPLFTFAAYLGAAAGSEPNGVMGAAVALAAIFLPGMLLVVAALPFWARLRAMLRAQSALRGTNAAVVGVLAAALYDPVFTSAITGPAEFALALTGFVLLTVWSAPAWAVVAFSALGGIAIAVV